MGNKKILLCSNILWTITQFRLGLIRALVNAGYEVVCVADTDDFSALSEQKAAEAGARFIRLKMNRKGTNPWQDFSYLVWYHRILKKEQPSLVINYTIKPVTYGSLVARILHIPSLAVTTGLGFVFISNNLLTRFTYLLYKFSLRFPAKVFFLNPDDLNAFIQHGIIHRSKAALLPGEGIDTDFYSPGNKIQSEKEFTFLLIARLLREKGVYEYVEAARLMHVNQNFPVRFRIVGYLDNDNPGGIGREELQKWIDEDIIEYSGTTEDIRPLIYDADCVVLPSYREGVPRTLLEAAAMQKPIIAANTPGCREVVEDGVNGYFCEPRNSRDLYDKMLKMLALSPPEREKMGKAGREKILAQFDEKIVISIYLEEIEKIFKGQGLG
jgi:glycosyltransferase involved in cell wall biosynthesis